MYSYVTHTLAPVYDSSSRVLILGTMPSPKSREAGFYYAHPQNRFWPVLAALFAEPIPAAAADKKDFALRHHIALWDVLHAGLRGRGTAPSAIPCQTILRGCWKKARFGQFLPRGKRRPASTGAFACPAQGCPPFICPRPVRQIAGAVQRRH